MTEVKAGASFVRIEPNGAYSIEGSRCNHCGAVFLGSREACGRCGKRGAMVVEDLQQGGTLYCHTVVHRSYPGIRVPFISAIVDLDGGGVIKSNLEGLPPDSALLRPGLRLKVQFRNSGEFSEEWRGYMVPVVVPDLESN